MKKVINAEIRHCTLITEDEEKEQMIHYKIDVINSIDTTTQLLKYYIQEMMKYTKILLTLNIVCLVVMFLFIILINAFR